MNKKYRNLSTEVFLSVILFITSLFEVPSPALATEAELNFDSICPRHRRLRTPQEVLEDHLAAFVSGDAALVACDYARDAVFIQPGAVGQGRHEIQATFAFFFGIAGGNIAVFTNSLTFAANAALFEYAVDSNNVVVSDGVDTFVIRNGLIAVHTAHLGGLSFK